MSVDVALLEEVKRRILAEPAQLQMANLFVEDPTSISDAWDLKRDHIPNCGTAACIKGWAIAIKSQVNPKEAIGKFFNNVFGLTPIDGWDGEFELMKREDPLIFVYAWPADLQERWAAEQTLEGRAQIACERIDRFIEQHRDKEEANA